jgi:hypothetical protein
VPLLRSSVGKHGRREQLMNAGQLSQQIGDGGLVLAGYLTNEKFRVLLHSNRLKSLNKKPHAEAQNFCDRSFLNR